VNFSEDSSVRRERPVPAEGRPATPEGIGTSPPGKLAAVLGAILETVLLAYLVGTVAFTRDFAHLHLTVHGVPLFTGELSLLALTALAAANLLLRGTRRLRLGFAGWALLAVLAAGALLAVRGMQTSPGLAVARDFALVYYGWFFFLTLACLRSGGSSERLLGALLVGATIGALAESGRFLASPTLEWGHATPGFNGMPGLTGVVLALAVVTLARSVVVRGAAAVAAVVSAFELYATGYRTMLVVAAVAVIAASVRSRLVRSGNARRFARLLWAWAALMAALIGAPLLIAPSPSRIVPTNGPVALRDAFGSVSHRWTGRHFGARAEPLPLRDPRDREPEKWAGSVGFRLLVWRNAAAQIKQSPWLGIGFGSEVLLFPAWSCDTVPSATSNCGAAHNTYLTLAMRLGVPLALLLCSALGWTLVRAAVSVLSGPDSAERFTTFVAALLLLSFLVFGTTGLLFESPYLSSVVWVLAGIVAERTRPAARGAVREPS
jgi:hypothetical protein